MWGGGYNNNNYGGNMQERQTDNFIQQNIPGGLNSKSYYYIKLFILHCFYLGPMGEQLDNMLGGNPNPTYGQAYGGAPGVGGFNNMGGAPYGGSPYGGGQQHHHHHQGGW